MKKLITIALLFISAFAWGQSAPVKPQGPKSNTIYIDTAHLSPTYKVRWGWDGVNWYVIPDSTYIRRYAGAGDTLSVDSSFKFTGTITNHILHLNPKDTTGVDSVLAFKKGRLYKILGGGSSTNLGNSNLTQSDPTRTFTVGGGFLQFIGTTNSEINITSEDTSTEKIISAFDVAKNNAQMSSGATNTSVNESNANVTAGMDDGLRKAPYINALVIDSLARQTGISINQDTTQDIVIRGLHHIGLTGNELFTVSGDPNQYVQFGNLTVGSGTVTSITPGVGFLSHTPITTSGTMDIDTASTIVTKTFAGRYSTTVTFHPSALGDITSGSVSGPTLQPNLTIISSVGLSGNPTSTTQTTGENTNRIATDAFVNASISAITPISAANPTASAGTTPVNGSATTFMRSDAAPKVDSAAFTTKALIGTYLTKAQVVATYAPLASPALTGTPTAPTATVGTNTTQVATTAFVLANAGGTTFANPTASIGVTPVNGSATTAMRSDAAPKADTTALRTVANSRTLAQEQTALNLKAPIASPTFTGVVTIPTPFTLGSTSVTSTGTQLNYLNAATGTTGTTSTNIVFSTSPTLITPTLGAATATSINGNAFTTGTYTLTGAAGKTLTFNNSITLAGTDATTMTFPTTSQTIPGLSQVNAFTGTSMSLTNSQNSATTLMLSNVNTGAAATAGIGFTNNIASTASIMYWGGNATAFGPLTKNAINFYNDQNGGFAFFANIGNAAATIRLMTSNQTGLTVYNTGKVGLNTSSDDGTNELQINGSLKLETAGNELKITEGTNGTVGQVALVSGTKAITITGITTSTRAFVTLVSPTGTSLTTSYQAICTSNTLTLQANVAAGTINIADGSTLNYWVIN